MKGQGGDCKIIVVFKIFFIFIVGSSQLIWLITRITITRICQLIQIEILDTDIGLHHNCKQTELFLTILALKLWNTMLTLLSQVPT